MPRHLGVDDRELFHARAVDQPQAARDGGAGVVRQRAVAFEPETVDQQSQPARMGMEVEVGARGPFRIAGAGKIDHVAGAALAQGRQQLAPGEAVHRPAMHQQQRRSGAEAAQRQPRVAGVDAFDRSAGVEGGGRDRRGHWLSRGSGVAVERDQGSPRRQ